jgi:hypothetical protein
MPCVRGSAASSWRAGSRKERKDAALLVAGSAVGIMHCASKTSRAMLNPLVRNSTEMADISQQFDDP